METKPTKEEAEKGNKSTYYDYFQFSRMAITIPSHRILGRDFFIAKVMKAINRGEEENALKVSVSVDKDKAIEKIKKIVLKSRYENLVEKHYL